MSAKGAIHVVAAVIRHSDNTVLIAQRPKHHRIAGGLWEFPGGKVESGELPESALVREIQEELGVEISVGKLIKIVNHVYEIEGLNGAAPTSLRILLSAYDARLVNEPRVSGDVIFDLNDVAQVEWVSGECAPPHEFAPADIPLLEKIWPESRPR